MLKFYFPILFIVIMPTWGLCQSTVGQNGERSITTAVPFLAITPDSRSAGMGDVGVATSPDIHSTYWNAAKLAFIEKDYGVSISYSPWLRKIVNDMFLTRLSGFYKISSLQSVGMSMTYFSSGSYELNRGPTQNDVLGRYSPKEFSLDATYSRILLAELSIGASIRYIHSNLLGDFSLPGGAEATPGNSIAVDIGLFYTKSPASKRSNLSFGLALSNFGAKIAYSTGSKGDFIPTNLRLGGAYKKKFGTMHSVAIALDINKLMVPTPVEGSRDKNLLEGVFGSFGDALGGFREELREISLSVGIEYWFKERFAGRFGTFLEAEDKGNRKYFTLGIGAKAYRFGLDVAYMLPVAGVKSPLAETIRFSVKALFNKKIKDKDKDTSSTSN